MVVTASQAASETETEQLQAGSEQRSEEKNRQNFEHVQPQAPQSGWNGSPPHNGYSHHSNHHNNQHSNRNNHTNPNSHHSQSNLQNNSGGSDGDAVSPGRLWPLSTVAKEDRTSGNVMDEDISPEELRAFAYTNAPRGQSAQVSQREHMMVNEYRQKLATVLPGGLTASSSISGPGPGPSSGHAVSDAALNDPFAPVANVSGRDNVMTASRPPYIQPIDPF